ncbi:hypothetical protein AHAS_Ahas15G0151800 [Arachis hypogaea]
MARIKEKEEAMNHYEQETQRREAIQRVLWIKQRAPRIPIDEKSLAVQCEKASVPRQTNCALPKGIRSSQVGRKNKGVALEASQPQQASTQSQSHFDLASVVAELSKSTHSFIQETRASLRNLEMQVGQLSKKIPERPPNTLPSDIVTNLREECKTL